MERRPKPKRGAKANRPTGRSPQKRSPKRRGTLLRVLLFLVLALMLVAAVWTRWVYWQIESYASQDQAAPSDAIVVFGAAEYDGKPSPVFRARLDHAYSLYQRSIAPLIVTLGGNGGDRYSEGEVGEDYLESKGVPEEAIIAETESRSTEDSARRVAVRSEERRVGKECRS